MLMPTIRAATSASLSIVPTKAPTSTGATAGLTTRDRTLVALSPTTKAGGSATERVHLVLGLLLPPEPVLQTGAMQAATRCAALGPTMSRLTTIT